MEPQASQSQDCEATPPLQRHNSNFYLPPMDGGGDSPRHNMRLYHARHSPHARQRYKCIEINQIFIEIFLS